MNNAETSPPPAAPPHKKWKAVLLLVLVFFLGGVAGSGGAALFMLKKVQANLRNPIMADSAGIRFLNRVNRNLAKELKLNSEEQAAVREELDTTRDRLREIRSGLLRDARSLAGDTLERISKRLPEAKRELLQERFSERLRPWGVEPAAPVKP